MDVNYSELNSKYEQLLCECRKTRDDHDARIKALEEATPPSDKVMAEYDTKLSCMEAMLLKNNLRFIGIQPYDNSVEQTVRHFLADSLKLPADRVSAMEITKCYRVGKPDPTKSTDMRTILVTFLRQNDVSVILTAAGKKPKGVPGGVREDLPIAWAKRRQELFKTYIVPARKEIPGVKIKWDKDTVLINNIKMGSTDLPWNEVKPRINTN